MGQHSVPNCFQQPPWLLLYTYRLFQLITKHAARLPALCQYTVSCNPPTTILPILAHTLMIFKEVLKTSIGIEPAYYLLLLPILYATYAAMLISFTYYVLSSVLCSCERFLLNNPTFPNTTVLLEYIYQSYY